MKDEIGSDVASGRCGLSREEHRLVTVRTTDADEAPTGDLVDGGKRESLVGGASDGGRS